MELFIFIFIMLFLSAIQTAIPYLVKRTVVFGVYVPEKHLNDHRIHSYKKMYSLMVALSSLIVISIYLLWVLKSAPSIENLVFYGTLIEFAIIFFSLALYFFFYGKMSQLKRNEKWSSSSNQVQAADLNVREEDNMLPWYVYLLPILVTIGVIIYTVVQYDLLPDQIPTHWGINGQPDAFTEKSIVSAISMPLILLVMQIMFLGFHFGYRQSGIKISAANVAPSRHRQLTLRRYTSWFMYIVALLTTLMFTFFQLTTIHPDLVSNQTMLFVPLIFMIVVFAGTVVFAVKVGRSDKTSIDQGDANIQDYDEDQFWIGGIFYINKNDPSILVEKRFGIGWTINFGNPKAYLIALVPLLIILLVIFLT